MAIEKKILDKEIIKKGASDFGKLNSPPKSEPVEKPAVESTEKPSESSDGDSKSKGE